MLTASRAVLAILADKLNAKRKWPRPSRLLASTVLCRSTCSAANLLAAKLRRSSIDPTAGASSARPGRAAHRWMPFALAAAVPAGLLSPTARSCAHAEDGRWRKRRRGHPGGEEAQG